MHELTLVSYNVHSCVGSDAKYSVERVAEAIKTVGPDIVCLQEIEVNLARQKTRIWSTVHNDRQPEKIANLLGMDHFEFAPAIRSVADSSMSFRASFRESHDVEEAENGLFGIAILSKHPIRQKLTHVYQRYGNKTTRNALACLVELPNGSRVWVVTTHLGCHWGAEQHQQSRELVTFIDMLLSKGVDSLGAALCGDFNSLSSFKSLKTLTKGGMTDAWMESSAGSTFPAPGLIPFCNEPFLRLDYIFVKEQSEGSLGVTRSFVVKRAGRASDHLPLCAVIHIHPVDKT